MADKRSLRTWELSIWLPRFISNITFLKANINGILFLISPVINLTFLEEFEGVNHEGKLDVRFIDSLRIFVSTNRVDKRVGQKFLFNLHNKLSNGLMDIYIRDGEVHTNVISPSMLKYIKQYCY